MANNKDNVLSAKPAATGGIWMAPANTTAPTDATTALGNDFVCLGYIDEDGVTNAPEFETEDKKAWGGDIYATNQTSYSETYKWKMVETTVDIMKLIYGDDKVSATAASGGNPATMSVSHSGVEREEHVFVIETVAGVNKIRRVVIPHGKLSEIGEIAYNDSDALGYEITIKALVDGSGNSSYEYFSGV